MLNFLKPKPQNYKDLYQHLKQFFQGHTLKEFNLNEKPIVNALPHFKVFEISPGPKTELWTYVSAGGCEVDSENGFIEFAIIAPSTNFVHVKLLAMTAFYHLSYKLGKGHTFPIGESWLENSKCDHFLVSLPYPYGPEFENWNINHHNHKHGHIFWLLPITVAEKNYLLKNGLESLEQKFETQQLEYWKPERKSVV